MANSSFAFWNFPDFFSLNIFDLWVVEFQDAELQIQRVDCTAFQRFLLIPNYLPNLINRSVRIKTQTLGFLLKNQALHGTHILT